MQSLLHYSTHFQATSASSSIFVGLIALKNPNCCKGGSPIWITYNKSKLWRRNYGQAACLRDISFPPNPLSLSQLEMSEIILKGRKYENTYDRFQIK